MARSEERRVPDQLQRTAVGLRWHGVNPSVKKGGYRGAVVGASARAAQQLLFRNDSRNQPCLKPLAQKSRSLRRCCVFVREPAEHVANVPERAAIACPVECRGFLGSQRAEENLQLAPPEQ